MGPGGREGGDRTARGTCRQRWRRSGRSSARVRPARGAVRRAGTVPPPTPGGRLGRAAHARRAGACALGVRAAPRMGFDCLGVRPDHGLCLGLCDVGVTQEPEPDGDGVPHRAPATSALLTEPMPYEGALRPLRSEGAIAPRRPESGCLRFRSAERRGHLSPRLRVTRVPRVTPHARPPRPAPSRRAPHGRRSAPTRDAPPRVRGRGGNGEGGRGRQRAIPPCSCGSSTSDSPETWASARCSRAGCLAVRARTALAQASRATGTRRGRRAVGVRPRCRPRCEAPERSVRPTPVAHSALGK